MNVLKSKNKISSFIERGRTGYTREDHWNLDMTLLNVMVKGMKDLSQCRRGYPAGYESEEKWNKDFREALASLEAVLLFIDNDGQGNNYDDIDKYIKAEKRVYKNAQKGLNFVAKNFWSLWC